MAIIIHIGDTFLKQGLDNRSGRVGEENHSIFPSTEPTRIEIKAM